MRIGKLLLCIAFGLSSCQPQEICDNHDLPFLVVRFKTIQSSITSDTIISGVTLYGIREGKADSLLYDSLSLSRMELPLDPSHNYSNFVFSVYDLTDTLTIVHTNDIYLISYSCGFATRFTLDGID